MAENKAAQGKPEKAASDAGRPSAEARIEAFTRARSNGPNLSNADKTASGFRRTKSWLTIWVVIGVGVLGVGVIALSMTFFFGKVSVAPSPSPLSNIQTMYGFQQGKTGLNWWVIRISQTQGNTFNFTWNAPPEKNGLGTGRGQGSGTIANQVESDGSRQVSIKIIEVLKPNPKAGFTFNFGFGSKAEPTQAIDLDGMLVGKGKKLFMSGNFMQRGSDIDPSTQWVLSVKAPPGWHRP
ncbi:MAG: hypothetical protein WCA07_12205 [Gloeobacterales cyanobacterium]